MFLPILFNRSIISVHRPNRGHQESIAEKQRIREIVVSAYTRSGVYDHIKIKRLSVASLLLLRGHRFIDKLCWYLNCKKHYVIKIYNRLKNIGRKTLIKKLYKGYFTDIRT